jgi:hypothetical protein
MAMAFEITNVWRNTTPELQTELIDFWQRHGAVIDPKKAQARASQAVLIARDDNGALCGVATAMLCVIPRLRQPTYYYRQFFSPEHRGNKQGLPFFQEAVRVLEAGNKAKPESLGVLIEIETSWLNGFFTQAIAERTGGVFIGYSPSGHQLRVNYFEGATLFPPAQLRPAAVAPVAVAAPAVVPAAAVAPQPTPEPPPARRRRAKKAARST